ncbi:MAG: RNA polymerase sigma factor [Chloroflexota bacterium]
MLEQRCRIVIQKLMEQYLWQLLNEDCFFDIVWERVDTDGVIEDEKIRKLAINTYCRDGLYPACLGEQGQQKRERGFEELAIYLYPIARTHWPHIADEVVQEALVRIYTTMANCRQPGAFLAFAIQKLRDGARRLLKKPGQNIALDELISQNIASQHSYVSQKPDENVLKDENKISIEKKLEQVKKMNPKSKRQLEAVRLRYICELKIEEIAKRLEVESPNASVLINRGLQKCRDSGLFDDLE